ncbi:MAG: IS4 family transposase [Saprospiraceae bacterium]
MTSTFDKSIHKFSLSRAECVATYRFLDNPRVSEEILINRMMKRTQVETKGKRVICIGDTTEWNLMRHKRRINLKSSKIGVISDNYTYGFMSHNILGIDRDSLDPHGWLSVEVFNRPIDNEAFTRDNDSVPIEEKESYKWLSSSLKAKEVSLKSCTHALFVTDRESDIYEYMCKIPDEKTDILFRASQNRRVINETGDLVKVFDDIGKRNKIGEVSIKIQDNKKREDRTAVLEVRSIRYKIQRPEKKWVRENYPKNVELTMINAKEQNPTLVGEDPVEWYLWTTEQVNGIEDCREKLELYKQRWKVEEAHRLLKKEGFNLESSELETPEGIRKLLILGMEASLKIQQLKEARDGNTSIAVKEVFEDEEVKCLEQLNEVYQGATEKQKNPHPKHSLAWASWIIARIGGWKGYASQRKPGTITYKWGYEKFQTLMVGYRLKNSPP